MLYENMTFENIMDRCLSRVAASIDKREGSVVYDAIWPTFWTVPSPTQRKATT